MSLGVFSAWKEVYAPLSSFFPSAVVGRQLWVRVSGSSCVTVTQRDMVCNGSRDAIVTCTATSIVWCVACVVKKPQFYAYKRSLCHTLPFQKPGEKTERLKLKNNLVIIQVM